MIEPMQKIPDERIPVPPVFKWMTEKQRNEFEEWYDNFVGKIDATLLKYEADLSDAIGELEYLKEKLEKISEVE